MSSKRRNDKEKEPIGEQTDYENDLHFAIREHESVGYEDTVESVEACLADAPVLAKGKNEYKENPLHTGMRYGAPGECIKRIYDAFPDIVDDPKHKNNKVPGAPLHMGCAYHAPSETIKVIVDANPKAAEEQDSKGRTPLHVLFDNQESFGSGKGGGVGIADTVKIIVEAKNKKNKAVNLKVLEIKDKMGRTPLHVALLNNAPHIIIQTLVDLSKKAVRIQDTRGRTPLHIAIQKQHKQKTIFTVLHAYTKATNIEDNSKRTPLHIAMQTHESEAVVNELMDKCPKVLVGKVPKNCKVQDIKGMTPLHCGLDSRAPIEPVLAVLKAFPKAVHKVDKDKRLPIHVAMANQYKANPIIEELIDTWPKSIKLKEIKKRTPLHVGMEGRSHVCATKLVITKHPDAVRQIDYQKRTPLHLGMRFDARKKSIERLLEESKVISRMRDINGSTPVHLGLEKMAPFDVIEIVINDYKQVVTSRDDNGRTPLHVIVSNNSTHTTVTNSPTYKADIIKLLLSIENGDKAAVMTDIEGKTPYSIAMENKKYIDKASLNLIEKAFEEYKDTAEEGFTTRIDDDDIAAALKAENKEKNLDDIDEGEEEDYDDDDDVEEPERTNSKQSSAASDSDSSSSDDSKEKKKKSKKK